MHTCSLHPCPSAHIAFDQSEPELELAAQAVHTCEQCGQWDAAGLVAIDIELHIINLDNQRPILAVCHACSPKILERTN